MWNTKYVNRVRMYSKWRCVNETNVCENIHKLGACVVKKMGIYENKTCLQCDGYADGNIKSTAFWHLINMLTRCRQHTLAHVRLNDDEWMGIKWMMYMQVSRVSVRRAATSVALLGIFWNVDLLLPTHLFAQARAIGTVHRMNVLRCKNISSLAGHLTIHMWMNFWMNGSDEFC